MGIRRGFTDKQKWRNRQHRGERGDGDIEMPPPPGEGEGAVGVMGGVLSGEVVSAPGGASATPVG